MKSPVQGTVTSQDANHVAAFCAGLPPFSQHFGRFPREGDVVVARYVVGGQRSAPFIVKVDCPQHLRMNNSRFGIVMDRATDHGFVYRTIEVLGFLEGNNA